MATTAPQPPAKASPPSAPRHISLALQGGGSHGAFTWGVLDRLLEDERLEIAAVSGTSAGAMNAAALAAGHAQGGRQGARRALDKFWHSTAQQALLSPMQRTPLDRLLGRWNLDASPGYHWLSLLGRVFSPYQFNPFNHQPLRDILATQIDMSALRACRSSRCGCRRRRGRRECSRAPNAASAKVRAHTSAR